MRELGGTSYLSLGAGVQSTTLLLLADAGELPAPAAAIFADTHGEPAAVYAHLERLEREVSIPIVRVSAGDLAADVLEQARGGRKAPGLPWHVRNPDGSQGFMPRQCTRDYKVRAIARELRTRGHGPAAPVDVWLGFTLDELARLAPARTTWQTNRWPLFELGWTRHDCTRWLAARGWEVPRSACVYCPFHGDHYWRWLRDEQPADWQRAIAFDEAARRRPGVAGDLFLHRARVPLADVDLRTPEDRGQLSLDDEQAACSASCFT